MSTDAFDTRVLCLDCPHRQTTTPNRCRNHPPCRPAPARAGPRPGGVAPTLPRLCAQGQTATSASPDTRPNKDRSPKTDADRAATPFTHNP